MPCQSILSDYQKQCSKPKGLKQSLPPGKQSIPTHLKQQLTAVTHRLLFAGCVAYISHGQHDENVGLDNAGKEVEVNRQHRRNADLKQMEIV